MPGGDLVCMYDGLLSHSPMFAQFVQRLWESSHDAKSSGIQCGEYATPRTGSGFELRG